MSRGQGQFEMVGVINVQCGRSRERYVRRFNFEALFPIGQAIAWRDRCSTGADNLDARFQRAA